MIKEAIKEDLKYAKLNASARTLDEIPHKVIKEHGLPEYKHLTGHPIGGFYKPTIAGFVDYGLEENMVFAYEPAVYISGRGGVRIEHHILVTADRYKVLTKTF